jgi:uncharacterized phage infection (PIP) family protein YhgE
MNNAIYSQLVAAGMNLPTHLETARKEAVDRLRDDTLKGQIVADANKAIRKFLDHLARFKLICRDRERETLLQITEDRFRSKDLDKEPWISKPSNTNAWKLLMDAKKVNTGEIQSTIAELDRINNALTDALESIPKLHTIEQFRGGIDSIERYLASGVERLESGEAQIQKINNLIRSAVIWERSADAIIEEQRVLKSKVERLGERIAEAKDEAAALTEGIRNAKTEGEDLYEKLEKLIRLSEKEKWHERNGDDWQQVYDSLHKLNGPLFDTYTEKAKEVTEEQLNALVTAKSLDKEFSEKRPTTKEEFSDLAKKVDALRKSIRDGESIVYLLNGYSSHIKYKMNEIESLVTKAKAANNS